MVTVSPISTLGLPAGASAQSLTNLLMNPSGDLLTAATSYNSTTGARTTTLYELPRAPTGYAAAPIAVGSLIGERVSNIVMDASGDVFGVINPSPSGAVAKYVFESRLVGGVYTAPVAISTLSLTGFSAALAVDSSGDLFGFDGLTLFEIAKVGATFAPTPTTLQTFSQSTSGPSGLALDAAADIFLTVTNYGISAGEATGDSQLVEVVKNPGGGYASTPTVLLGGNAAAHGGQLGAISLDRAGDIFVQAAHGSELAVIYLPKAGSSATGYGAATIIDAESAHYGYATTGDLALIDGQGDVFLVDAAGGTPTSSFNSGPGLIVHVAKVAGAYAPVSLTLPQGATPNAVYTFPAYPATGPVGYSPVGDLVADAAGVLYGVTQSGGPGGAGVFYAVTGSGYATTGTPPLTPAAPTLTGVMSPEIDPGGATLKPFAGATVTDTNAAATFTVQLQSVAVVNGQPGNLGTGGAFAGGGFTVAGGQATFTSTSLAAVQAAVQAVTFTPAAADARIIYTISDSAGGVNTASVDVLTTAAAPVNTPPMIGGALAGQADSAGVAISPFSAVTVTDPDANQSETVTVSFTAANGTLSGGGFVQTAPGVYSVTEPVGSAGASAAAAQADLRAAVFTPTAGQSATTTFTVTVSDGQAPAATDSATSVVATYTPPVSPPGGGGGGGTVVTTPPSVQYGLQTEFQNLSRAVAGGADALTPGAPLYAAFQAERAVAAQLDNGQVTLAQAETTLLHLVDGTTAVAVASYGFFTGSTPTAAGLNYLVHSGANATDLNDSYYARFTTENRYINFAVNLATGPGAGAAAFQASYGALSLVDATAKAYAAVFGAMADAAKVSALLDTLVPDGLGGQETRAQYFAQYGGDGPNGQGTKAAMIGFLLSNSVHDGSGVYGAATEHYLSALAHGSAPAMGSELALHYGPAVSLVGVTSTPDPTVTG